MKKRPKRIEVPAKLIVVPGYRNTGEKPSTGEILLAVENMINNLPQTDIIIYGPNSAISAGIRIHIDIKERKRRARIGINRDALLEQITEHLVNSADAELVFDVSNMVLGTDYGSGIYRLIE